LNGVVFFFFNVYKVKYSSLLNEYKQYSSKALRHREKLTK